MSRNMHWSYYLALEKDFAKTFRYVEPCADNANVYSIEYVGLYLAIGSEIDTVLKETCKALGVGRDLDCIGKYRNALKGVADVKTVLSAPVKLLRYPLPNCDPWKGWLDGTLLDENGKPTSPKWWKSLQ